MPCPAHTHACHLCGGWWWVGVPACSCVPILYKHPLPHACIVLTWQVATHIPLPACAPLLNGTFRYLLPHLPLPSCILGPSATFWTMFALLSWLLLPVLPLYYPLAWLWMNISAGPRLVLQIAAPPRLVIGSLLLLLPWFCAWFSHCLPYLPSALTDGADGSWLGQRSVMAAPARHWRSPV